MTRLDHPDAMIVHERAAKANSPEHRRTSSRRRTARAVRDPC